MVEFALVLPLLATLIFGIIELSFVFYQDHTVNTASRLAARKGAVGATDAQIKTFVKGFCTSFGITDANIVITVTDSAGAVQPAGNRTAGNDLNVQVRHNLLFLTQIQSFFRQINCSAVVSSSQFVIE
jgi:Flp pilus assembly protein TadG